MIKNIKAAFLTILVIAAFYGVCYLFAKFTIICGIVFFTLLGLFIVIGLFISIKNKL